MFDLLARAAELPRNGIVILNSGHVLYKSVIGQNAFCVVLQLCIIRNRDDIHRTQGAGLGRTEIIGRERVIGACAPSVR